MQKSNMPQDLINKITDPSYYWMFDPSEDWTMGGAIYMVPFDYQYKYIYLAITVIDSYGIYSDSTFDLSYWPVSHTIDNEATIVSSYNKDIDWPFCFWEKSWNYDKNLSLSSFENSSCLKENCFNGFNKNKKTYIKTPVNPGLFILLYGRGDHDGDYFDWIKLEPLDESQYNIVQSTKDWRI